MRESEGESPRWQKTLLPLDPGAASPDAQPVLLSTAESHSGGISTTNSYWGPPKTDAQKQSQHVVEKSLAAEEPGHGVVFENSAVNPPPDHCTAPDSMSDDIGLGFTSIFWECYQTVRTTISGRQTVSYPDCSRNTSSGTPLEIWRDTQNNRHPASSQKSFNSHGLGCVSTHVRYSPYHRPLTRRGSRMEKSVPYRQDEHAEMATSSQQDHFGDSNSFGQSSLHTTRSESLDSRYPCAALSQTDEGYLPSALSSSAKEMRLTRRRNKARGLGHHRHRLPAKNDTYVKCVTKTVHTQECSPDGDVESTKLRP